MFLMLDIGFFTLLLIFVAVKWLLKTRVTTGKRTQQQTQTTYRSEYAQIELNGTHDKTVDGLHKREMEFRATQLERDHAYRMEALKRQTDLEIIQWGLLAIITLTYLTIRAKQERDRYLRRLKEGNAA